MLNDGFSITNEGTTINRNGKTFFFPQRPPTQDELDAAKLYAETGCVTQEYMRKTLSDPMKTVFAFGYKENNN